MNSSDPERFEAAYRRVWDALNRQDDHGLSHHERQLLHHVPPSGQIALHRLADHLALPKSTTSVLVKRLADEYGLLTRHRDPADERRLAIALTERGHRLLAADTVLDPQRLAVALASLTGQARQALLAGLEALAQAGEELTVRKQGA